MCNEIAVKRVKTTYGQYYMCLNCVMKQHGLITETTVIINIDKGENRKCECEHIEHSNE